MDILLRLLFFDVRHCGPHVASLFETCILDKLRRSSPSFHFFPVLSSSSPHPRHQRFHAFARSPAIHNPFPFGILPRRSSTMAEGGIAVYEQNSRQQQSDTDGLNQRIRRFKHPVWPEWILFLNRLKSIAAIDSGTLKHRMGDVRELFSDVALLKHAIVKFAQVHESILEKLPQNELDALTKYEFFTNDERTTAARKRVQKYLQMKESNVLSSGCDEEAPAKLKDVMRLIYRAVSDASCIDYVDVGRKEVVLQLLQNLVSLTSSAARTMISDKEHSHLKIETFIDDKESDQLHKKGSVQSKSLNLSDGYAEEWKCSRCSFVNIPAKELCVRCNQNRETKEWHQQKCTEPRNIFQSYLDHFSEVTSMQEPRKFQSIKERVDARRARLERERIQKEAASAATLSDVPLQQPVIHPKSNEVVIGIHGFSPVVRKNINGAVATHDSSPAKNFHDLDAIVASLDSDDDSITCKCTVRSASLSASVKVGDRHGGKATSHRVPSKSGSPKVRW